MTGEFEPEKLISALEDVLKKEEQMAKAGKAGSSSHRDKIAGLEKYLKEVEKNPNNSLAYSFLGHALSEVGAYAESASAYERSVMLEPNVRCYLLLGHAYAEQGKLEKAVSAYKKAVELGGDAIFLRVHSQLWAVLTQLGRCEEAMIHYKIQEELDKNECLPKSLIEDKLAKARELLQRDAKPETDK